MEADLSLIGLISDTHGLLRGEALEALRGSDLIVHAGDVGAMNILEKLREIAPVFAVKGNIDTNSTLPATAIVHAGDTVLYVIHDVKKLDLDPAAAGVHIVVSGHSHKPGRLERNGVMYINPGSAGPRRFHLPVTVARLDLAVRPWKPELIDLLAGGPPAPGLTGTPLPPSQT